MFKLIYLYIYTIRFLTIKQIIFRIYYIFFKSYNLKLKINSHSKISKINKKDWIIKNITFPDKNYFKFLNASFLVKNYKTTGIYNLSKLWLYNLHYFDYLITNDGLSKINESKKLIFSWIETDNENLKIGMKTAN